MNVIYILLISLYILKMNNNTLIVGDYIILLNKIIG